MTEETNYWDKLSNRKLSRRRLLSTTALVGAGLGAAAVVGCSSSTSENTSPSGSGSPGPSGSAGEIFLQRDSQKPVDGRQKFTPAPSNSRGDVLTYIGFDAVVLDRYDPHQTQFGPMYS